MRFLAMMIGGLAFAAAAGSAHAATTDITIIGKPAATPQQTPAAAAATAASTGVLRAYDGNKKLVGQIIAPQFGSGQGNVVIKINNIAYQIGLGTDGFGTYDASFVNFFHTSADCSGPRYLDASGLPPVAFAFSNTIYHPLAAQKITVMSVEYFQSGDDISLAGRCNPFTYTLYAGPAATENISSFGFVPPFSAKTP